jgi:rubredoxin
MEVHPRMLKKYTTIKINLPGGIVSAGDLYSIVTAAEAAKVDDVQFGIRQQLFLSTLDTNAPELKHGLENAGILFEEDVKSFPNIISSYVAEDVFDNANWLSEGAYKDILDHFDYRPGLKINLVDKDQTFVPFFTGNLNFISSPISNYWYLYIRFPKTNVLYRWKALIYSFDIPRISKLIEESIAQNADLFYEKENANGDVLYTMVHAKESFITQPVSEELQYPQFALPYYEGFNKYGNKSWLGIYRRNELYPVAFLKEACLICLKTKVGQLYTTPWKSLIVKGIEAKERKLWDIVLGKHRINVRHASNELNWQVEDLSEEALSLKRYIIRQFDKDDVRTYGLCFAIKMGVQTGLFGSVVIRKKDNESTNKRRALDRYDILYTLDFNPNSKDVVVFRSNVEKENLGIYLVSLCKYFYESKSQDAQMLHHIYRQEEKIEATDSTDFKLVYQCSHCYTVYDEDLGDEQNNIRPGTLFENLSGDYECAVCAAGKQDFSPIKKQSILQP